MDLDFVKDFFIDKFKPKDPIKEARDAVYLTYGILPIDVYKRGVLYRYNWRSRRWNEISLPKEVKAVSDIKSFGEEDIILATWPNQVIHFDQGKIKKYKVSSTTPNKIWGIDSENYWCTVTPLTWINTNIYKFSKSKFSGESYLFQNFFPQNMTAESRFSMTSIHGVDQNDIWAVGPNSTIYHYSKKFWKKESLIKTNNDIQLFKENYLLWDVFALDRNHVYAVGDNGIFLEYLSQPENP